MRACLCVCVSSTQMEDNTGGGLSPVWGRNPVSGANLLQYSSGQCTPVQNNDFWNDFKGFLISHTTVFHFYCFVSEVFSLNDNCLSNSEGWKKYTPSLILLLLGYIFPKYTYSLYIPYTEGILNAHWVCSGNFSAFVFMFFRVVIVPPPPFTTSHTINA